MKNKKTFNRQEQLSENTIPIKNQTTIPIHSYWFFAIMVVIASSMFVKHGTVDLQWNNSTYVIMFHYLVVTISILSLVFGFIYWSQRSNSLTKWMTNFHSLLTLAIMGTFYMTCFQEASWNIDSVIALGIGLFLIAQVVLILNIFLSKKNK